MQTGGSYYYLNEINSMSDIFISYSSQDRGRIQPIVQALESKGWSVWWDREIPIGRTFDEVIEEAIDEAKCMVVI